MSGVVCLLVAASGPGIVRCAWADGADMIAFQPPDDFGEQIPDDHHGIEVVLERAFPDGLRIGDREAMSSLYINRAGALSFTRPLVYAALAPPVYATEAHNPLLAPLFASYAASPPRDAERLHEVSWYEVPAGRDREGRLVVTWYRMGSFGGFFFDTNSFQLSLVDLGDGDARVEIRYSACEWSSLALGEGRSAPAFFGFGDGAGGGWSMQSADFDDSRGRPLLCAHSNQQTAGLWQFWLLDGQLVGCGDGVVADGEACDDGNARLGDGCTSYCQVEVDLDGDGSWEPPLGHLPPFEVAEGTYDDCVPLGLRSIEDGGVGCDADVDGDGVRDGAADNCDEVPNSDQADTDGDRLGDACDPDLDEDGWLNEEDNCPDVPNGQGEGAQPDADGDGLGDACDDDSDDDGQPDVDDNCPQFPNPEQHDLDMDGIGDPCDDDTDGDGVIDVEDNCPDFSNAEQLDLDGDRRGDDCDLDDDGDGILDVADDCPRIAGICYPVVVPACPGGNCVAPIADVDDSEDSEPEPRYVASRADDALGSAHCAAAPGSGPSDPAGGGLVLALLTLTVARRRAAS